MARFTHTGSGTIHVVDAATFRKEAPGVFERVRLARPGMIGRSQLDWDMRSDLRRWPEKAKPWIGFRDKWVDKRPRVTVKVSEMAAATPEVEARLWSFLAQMDWVQTVKAEDRPVDDVLPWLLADGRRARRHAGRRNVRPDHRDGRADAAGHDDRRGVARRRAPRGAPARRLARRARRRRGCTGRAAARRRRGAVVQHLVLTRAYHPA
jgi:hypothetical protein